MAGTNKGAIDLVVTKAALDQVTELNRKLELTEKQMIKISNLARSAQGNFKQTKGTKDLNAQLQKQSNILIQIVKNNKKYHDAAMKAAAGQKHLAQTIKKTGDAAKKSGSRVGSFFKTLVAFDLARRAVDAFWGSFKKGFEDLKKLDSLRLQFQYLVKDTQEARLTQSFLARVSEELGVSLLGLSESYLAFRKSAELANLSAKDSRQIFEDVTRAASLLGKSDDQIHNVQVALEQMLSKGTVQAEELKKQLGNVLPGSFEIMAKAVDKLNPKVEVTNEVFNKMLKAGKIIAADVLPEFARQLKLAYGIENVDRIDTLQAATVRLDNAFTIMIRNMEEGTGGLSKTILFFTQAITDLITNFGQLFLTAEQLANFEIEFNFEKGFKDGSDLVDDYVKKYEGNVEKVKKFAQEIADSDAWGLVAQEGQLKRLTEQLENTDPAMLFVETGMTADQLKKKIQELARQIGTTKGFVEGIDTALSDLEKTGKKDTTETRAKAQRIFAEETRGVIQELEFLKKVWETYRKTEKDPIIAAGFNKQVDIAKGMIDMLKGTDVAGKVAEDALKEWSDTVAEDLKRLGFQFEATEEQLKLYKKGLEEIADLETDRFVAGVELARTITDSLLEMKLNAIDKEMEKIQERYDLQKELIEMEEGDAEAKEERLRQLDKEKAIREKKLEKEREKAEKKAFLIQQAITAATIVAETAKGVAVATATYGSNPTTAPLLPGIIALIVGTGAIQLATVLAQSIPKFAQGHLAGSYEGQAIVNDGGRMEVIERKSGAIEMYSKKDALIQMNKGDKVHKSIDSFIERGGTMDHLVRASGFAGAGIGGFNEVRSEALGIKNEIKEGFRNIRITNDNTNVARIVADAISDAQYEKGFL